MGKFKELFEQVDAIDIFARELEKCKPHMNDTVYKKMHKLLMANDIKKADEGLNFLKRYKKC